LNKNLLKGVLIVLGVVILLWMTFPFGIILAIAFWIYLGVLVWKKKHVFKDTTEQVLTKKYLKRMKTFLIMAVISFPIGIAGIIIHNIRSASTGNEETLFFFIGIIVTYVFVLASAGGLIIFIKGRQTTK
jgi:hypothetical protein